MTQFKKLPKDINFNFNGKQIKMPLFCYVLRHTFWRPRDILLYYSNLLAIMHPISEKQYKITDEIIRTIISRNTYQIIKTEFIDEYQTTLRNIRDIINAFSKSRQIMKYNEIIEILSKTDFEFSQYYGVKIDLLSKVEFLYDIGFLGVALTEEQKRKMNIHCDHAFYFNEGNTAFRTIKKQNFEDANIAIHPIFVENLQLDSSSNDLLLNYNWDYLYEHDTIQAATRNKM